MTNLFGYQDQYSIPTAWSLYPEIKFYIFILLVFILGLGRSTLFWLFCLLISVSIEILPTISGMAIQNGTLLRELLMFKYFFCGILLCFAREKFLLFVGEVSSQKRSALSLVSIIFLIASFALFFGTCIVENSGLYNVYQVTNAYAIHKMIIICMCLFSLIILESLFLLKNSYPKWVVALFYFMGGISYPLYLIHPVLVVNISNWTVFLLVMVPVSFLLHLLLEKPFITFSKKLTKHGSFKNI